MQRLYLLDTMFLIFRAFHSMPPMRTPCGTPVNAVHGVLSTLRQLWIAERYTNVVAVFESNEPSFRKELDAEYKANRDPAPVELKAQVAMVRVACESMGIPTMNAEGYEADDVIGTLARQAVEADLSVTIVSNDKDLAQVLALSPRVELLRTGKGGRPERVDGTQVKPLFGVPPHLIAHWLALRGDPSDNIKGVHGIGPKNAVRLLNKHGSLHALLENPEKAGRFAPAFRDEPERILRDLDLATIRTDVDLGYQGFPEHRYQLRPFDRADEVFASMGMHGRLRRLERISHTEATVADFWATSSEQLRLVGASF